MNNVTSGLLRAELSDAASPSAITHLLVDLSRAEWRSGGQADKDRRDPHFHKRFCVAPSVNPKGRGRQRGSENEEGLPLFVRQRREEMSWCREVEGQRIMNDNELLGENPRHSQRNVVWQCEAKFRRQLLVESSPLQELERP